MGWMTEAAAVYDEIKNKLKDSEEAEMLLPLYHTTANAQIQVTLYSDGTFSHAEVINKDDAETVIPVTEHSNARTNNNAPHPLCDKLIYVAGDYKEYVKSKKKKAEQDDEEELDDEEPADEKSKDLGKFYSEYIKELKAWAESEYSDVCVKAIYNYLSKKTLIKDLLSCGVLKLDGKVLDEKLKIEGYKQADAFVRFAVENLETKETVCVWKSKELFEKFIAYYESWEQEYQLCYASGEIVPIVTEKHMAKIRNAGDRAKLISSDDKDNFTYRGRFSDDKEALSIGKVISQKAHLALRWLVKTGGISVDSTVYIAWESALNDIPNVFEELEHQNDEGLEWLDEDDDGKVYAKTAEQYKEIVGKAMKGYKQNLNFDSKIILMTLAAATTGRISMVMYHEFKSTDFYNNLENWYDTVCWHGCYKLNSGEVIHCVQTPIPYEIVKCAYGYENNKKLVVDTKSGIYKETIMQIYRCITHGERLPESICRRIFVRASNPQYYKNKSNWKRVLDVCCALHRKYYYDKERIEINMELDRNCRDRNYLYGRLMAVAEKIEIDTYKDEYGNVKEDEVRMTNSARFMNSVIEKPYASWGYVEKRLGPYMEKIMKKSYGLYAYYRNELGEIHTKFKPGEYEENKPLEPFFFMGYYGEQQRLYTPKDKNDKNSDNNENNKEED